MKLRLMITTPAGPSRPFEHSGPLIHIGRDPSCELVLVGEAGDAVSRRHARVELASAGATLIDLGSSNGTMLNDRRVTDGMPLRVGDRIQLGFTGAVLTVAELDLSEGTPGPSGRATWLKVGAGAGALGLIAIVVAIVALNRKPPPPPPETPQQPADVAVKPSSTDQPKQTPVVSEEVRGLPSADVREVGRYVALPQWGPSLLLQRRGDGYPWLPLRPEGRVAASHLLVSLPGFRSTVALDSGPYLTLWGNIREFSAAPPVAESVVMLHVPESGTELDFTLERGRVQVTNPRADRPVQVRMRFLRQVWDLTIPPDGEIRAHLLWLLTSPGGRQREGAAEVQLISRGPGQLRIGNELIQLKERSAVRWLSVAAKPPRVETLPSLPDWLTKPPDPKDETVAYVRQLLQDWSEHLAGSEEIVEAVLARTRRTKFPAQRELGLLFLAALDRPQHLIEVDFLENAQDRVTRWAAIAGLQSWLARSPTNTTELVRLLQQNRGYGRRKAETVVQLLSGEAVAGSVPLVELAGYLDHESLVIRELAAITLAWLAPQEAQKIAYDPAGDAGQRRQAVQRWKDVTPQLKVPLPREQ